MRREGVWHRVDADVENRAWYVASFVPPHLVSGSTPSWAREVLVGYGIDFDLAVLAHQRKVRCQPPLTNTALDCRRWALVLHPEWKPFGFDEVASHVGIGILGRHTAEGDAVAAAELLLAFIPEIRALGARTIGDLIWLQESTAPSF